MKPSFMLLRSWVVLATALFCASSFLSADPYSRTENMVVDAFNEVIERDPNRREMARYVNWVETEDARYHTLVSQLRKDYHWLLDDAYRTHADRFADNPYVAKQWVKEAFRDILNREPGKLELKNYATVCVDEKLSQRALRVLIYEDYEVGEWDDGDALGGRENWGHGSVDVEEVIREAYLDILNREPDESGLRSYRRLMLDEGWTEARVRHHIANSDEALWEQNSVIVIRAYEDMLGRKPSEREIEAEVKVVIQKRWNEADYRRHIRKSREYQYDRPRKIINEAYLSVMLRDADPSAYSGLRKAIVEQGWDRERVEKHLRESSEYRTKVVPQMVDRAYEEILKRKPDPSGKRFYLSKALQGWTFEDIKQHMMDSEEYREKFL
jgi:hypothetical protein